MTAPQRRNLHADDRDRLLIIGSAEHTQALRDLAERHYADIAVHTSDTFLSGIAEATRAPVRAALASVDPQLTHIEQAVGGLRDAIGPRARLILCCAPHQEPAARRLVRTAADDYLVAPIDHRELDQAIGYARPEALPAPHDAPVATMEELESIGALLSTFDARPTELLEQLADVVRRGVNAKGATVIVQGSVATSGDVVIDPVIAAPLQTEEGVIGQLTLGPCAAGAYAPQDIDKIKSYASVAGRIIETAANHRHLRRLAETDECSGLPNRRHLYRHLDEILDRARRERFPVTLLIFDIDNFKTYNDELGHDAGDKIIRTVGEVFRRLCRAQDIVARLGGDEFAVVFWDPDGPRTPGSEHPDSALTVLDRVRDALKREPLSDPESSTPPTRSTAGVSRAPALPLTISGGLASFPWDAGSREELLLQADQALLIAKRAGKNRIYLIGEPSGR